MEDIIIDYTKELPANLEFMIGCGGIIAISAVLLLAIVLMKGRKGRIFPMFMGLMAYIILTFIPVNLILTLLSMIPSVSLTFEYNEMAYTLLNCAFTAVACLGTRIITSKMIEDRYERKADVYMAGLGVGLGEGILYAMTAISMYIWCIAINSDGLQSVLSGMSLEEQLESYASMEMLYTAPAVIWLLFGLNAVMDMIIQMLLTNVTYGVVKGQLPKLWYGISVAVSFVLILSFQLYDETSLVSLLVFFAIKLILFCVAAYYAGSRLSKSIIYIEE